MARAKNSDQKKQNNGANEEQHAKLEAKKSQGADPEGPDEYRALNIFWVPLEARWSHRNAQANFLIKRSRRSL